MKNKLIIGALTLIAVLAIVVPAVAQTKHASAPAASFTASGSVQDVIRSAGALRMHVAAGSRGVKPFIGGALVVRVASKARILKVSDDSARLITLSGIRAGDHVVVSGRIDRSQPRSPVFVAQTIRVIDRTPAAKLTHFACRGPVTAIDTQGAPNMLRLTLNSASRALWHQLGASLAVVVTPDTQIFLKSQGTTTAISLSQVVVGERAWVTGTIDRSQATPVFTAGRITVQAAPAATPTTSPGG